MNFLSIKDYNKILSLYEREFKRYSSIKIMVRPKIFTICKVLINGTFAQFIIPNKKGVDFRKKRIKLKNHIFELSKDSDSSDVVFTFTLMRNNVHNHSL